MSENKPSLGVTTWLPLATGLVGVVVGATISIVTVERQIQVGHEQEQRSTRAEAYMALIDSADVYANRTNDVLAAQSLRGDISAEVIESLRTDYVVGQWLNARNDFQDALNRAYIYGSSDGWDAALDLAGDLPYAQGERYEWVEVSAAMSDDYRALLRVICEESTVSPRDDCSADAPIG